jgi:hypothetical protein
MDVLIVGLAIFLTLSLLAACVVMGAIVAGSRSDEVLDEGRLVVPELDPPQTARPLSGAEGA